MEWVCARRMSSTFSFLSAKRRQVTRSEEFTRAVYQLLPSIAEVDLEMPAPAAGFTCAAWKIRQNDPLASRAASVFTHPRAASWCASAGVTGDILVESPLLWSPSAVWRLKMHE